MSNLSKSKHLFGFTSPRTIEKITPEIRLLVEKFGGMVWRGNDVLQVQFFNDLFKTDFYEGDIFPNNPAFAARDRITRAPKALGFIDLEPNICLTLAGEQLLNTVRPHEIITKQLLKFQLPSPYHTQSRNTSFFVKPYLELLRLLYELGGLSKTEIALFFLQLIHIDKYNDITRKIIEFREGAKKHCGSRKLYTSECFKEELLIIFSQEIVENNFQTRESDDASLRKFLRTKQANMMDYADAFIRYIRATKLVTFEKRTFRIIIAESKLVDVEYILQNIERKPLEFKDSAQFKSYLFSADNVELLSDNRDRIKTKLLSLGVDLSLDLTTEHLKDFLEQIEDKKLSIALSEVKQELKSYNQLDDIVDVFDKISKKEVPDLALFLEWNVWRALVMLNYAQRIDGNFAVDIDGMPLNTAPGKKPDIEIDYDDFSLIVEVTMSSGQKQYDMEGEPVARHYGRAKEEINDNMYCLFVAPKVSDGTLAHFFNINRQNTKYYGGKTKIIPMNLSDFIQFIEQGVEYSYSDPKLLQRWLDCTWKYNQECADEIIWLNSIKTSIARWCVPM